MNEAFTISYFGEAKFMPPLQRSKRYVQFYEWIVYKSKYVLSLKKQIRLLMSMKINRMSYVELFR